MVCLGIGLGLTSAHPTAEAEVPAQDPDVPALDGVAKLYSPPPCTECGHQPDPVLIDERWRAAKKARRRERAPVG